MDVKEITQKIIDTYKVAQTLYENDAPIYGNNTPICPPYEDLYKFIVYIQDANREIYLKLQKIFSSDAVLLIPDVIQYLSTDIPAGYILIARFLVFELNQIFKNKNAKKL